MLGRPTESEVGRLLLQGRSTSNRAETCQVDGLDGECRPPERHSSCVAFARPSGNSHIHRVGEGEREWCRASDCGCERHRHVRGVRLFVFNDPIQG